MLGMLTLLLGADCDLSGELLNLLLANVTQIVLDYCHIDELPEALESTVARMTADLIRAGNFGVYEAGGAVGAVDSIKEGDTTVHFGGDSLVAISGASAADLLHNYKRQLVYYRQLPW